jgi:hypothetical protein
MVNCKRNHWFLGSIQQEDDVEVRTDNEYVNLSFLRQQIKKAPINLIYHWQILLHQKQVVKKILSAHSQ